MHECSCACAHKKKKKKSFTSIFQAPCGPIGWNVQHQPDLDLSGADSLTGHQHHGGQHYGQPSLQRKAVQSISIHSSVITWQAATMPVPTQLAYRTLQVGASNTSTHTCTSSTSMDMQYWRVTCQSDITFDTQEMNILTGSLYADMSLYACIESMRG